MPHQTFWDKSSGRYVNFSSAGELWNRAPDEKYSSPEGVIDNSCYENVENFGLNWLKSASGPTQTWRPIISSFDGNKVYVSNDNTDQLYTSINRGVTYSTVPSQPGTYTRTVQCCSSSGDIVYCLGTDSEFNVDLYKSINSGTSWQVITDPEYDYANGGNTVCSADGQIMYTVATHKIDSPPYNVYLLKSINGGETWNRINNIATSDSFSSVWCSGNGLVVVACSGNAGETHYWLSVNGGENWSLISDLPNSYLYSVSLSNDGSIIYMATWTGLYVSNNTGSSFVNSGIIGDSNRMGCSFCGKYAITSSIDTTTLYVTGDYGVTWVSVETQRNWTSTGISGDATLLIASVFNEGMYYTHTI